MDRWAHLADFRAFSGRFQVFFWGGGNALLYSWLRCLCAAFLD